jgi:hypothetical protein
MATEVDGGDSRRKPRWGAHARPIRFAAAVRVAVIAYIVMIGAIVVLRGIDAAINF